MFQCERDDRSPLNSHSYPHANPHPHGVVSILAATRLPWTLGTACQQ